MPYQAFEERVFLHLSLVQPSNHQVLAQTDIWLLQEDLPTGLSIQPDLSAENKERIMEFDVTPVPTDTSLRAEGSGPELYDGGQRPSSSPPGC